MTALTFNRLADYPFKPVHEVRRGKTAIGLLEEQNDGQYKAFVGTGFSCKYLAKYYSPCAAVKAIERAANYTQ